jgi:hypothetical protein
VGLFTVVGALCFLLTQALLVHGLQRFDAANVGIMNRVMQGGIDARVLISGSSRAMFHYDPRIIEAATGRTAFNIGRNGTRLHEQLHLLKLYLRRNRAPDYLIQNVDLTSLTNSTEITDPKQYIPWLHEDDVYKPLFTLRPYFVVYRAFPLVAIARTSAAETAVRGLMSPGAGEVTEHKGYAPQSQSWNEDFEKFRARNPAGVMLPIDPPAVAALRELVGIADQYGIRLTFVYSPEFQATQQTFRNRREVLQTIRDLSVREHVPFWDYSDDPISSDQANFYNSQHLNERGATAFSRSLARRLADGMHEAGQVSAPAGR